MTAPSSLLSRSVHALLLCLLAPLLYAQEVELIPSGPVSLDESTGEIVATEGAQILYGDWLLSAETIRYNQQTGEAFAQDKVVFSRADLRLTGDSLLYQPEEQFARVVNFRAGNGRVYVDGSLLEGNPDDFRFTDVNFYPGEPGTFLFEARAGELSLVDQNVIRGKRLFFKVGPVPFLLIPSITQPLDAETNLFEPTLDYSGHIGAAIGAEALIPVSKDLRLGGNLALTSKRGVLAGPSARYDYEGDDYLAVSSFVSGYIDDQGELGLDVRGEAIDPERYFADWQHKQIWHDNRINLSSYLRWWSDSEVTRDFHESSFDEMQDPDSYLEGNYNGTNWQLSLFTRIALNDFQGHTERLPELRFTYFPTEIADGLSHSGFISAAHLDRENATFDRFDIDSSAIRLDGYYGFDFHHALRPGVDLRLKAGARGTHYEDGEFPIATGRPDIGIPDVTLSHSGTRAFGEVGLDLNLKAYATHEFKNDAWDIDGIRHIFEPQLSYRYTPDLQVDDDFTSVSRFLLSGTRVNPFAYDRRVFANYLDPIDLEDRRDVESIQEDHKIRLALKNRIQTRAKDKSSRDLARFDIVGEYHFEDQSILSPFGLPEDNYSYLHFDFSATPADWLEIGIFSRLDAEEGFAERETNARIVIQDSGYWKLGFGSHFLKAPDFSGATLSEADFPGRLRLEQYYGLLEYQFSENLKLYAVARYDADSGTFYEQRVGIMQRALERYGLKYELRIYEGERRETDFGISLGIDLFD